MNITSFSIRATLIAISISIIASIYSYQMVYKEKIGMLAGGLTVARDIENLSIFQDDRCIGNLKSEWVAVPDGVELRVKGSLLAGDIFTLDGQISFNPIGQCLGSVIRIVGKNSKIVIGSKGIYTIEIIVNASIGDKHFKFNLPAEGPIEVIKGAKANTIIFPHTRNLFSMTEIQNHNSLLKELGSLRSERKECEQLSNLEVPDALIQALNTLEKLGQGSIGRLIQ